MAKIIVIDGAPFWRELAADGLRLKGHYVSTAEDGLAGLAKLTTQGAELVILEAQLTGLQGLLFIEQVRNTVQWKSLPIIMLTSEMHKEQMVRARQLGVVDYVLKTQFSLKDLIERVERRLDPQVPAIPILSPETAVSAPKQLLNREQCLARAVHAMGGRTLSGVVSKVVASASSPRTDLADLATLVGHDPMLSARVVGAANRLENASDRRSVSTLMDAVRVVGSSTVRDIASSFWVYDAMPQPEPDGYNPIRCWQHSIAVARLCEILASEEDQNIAYLLGLCHDLGEILFRSHFGTEYRQVLEAAHETGRPRAELEKLMLGVTHGEMVLSILEHLELPGAILQPIAAFHAAMEQGAIPSGPAERLLVIADAFSTGLMLNSSEQQGVRPLNRSECRAATGSQDPPPLNCKLFHSEVMALTAECARLGPREQAMLIQPAPHRRPVKVWLARDPLFSSFDPIATLLDPLVELSVFNRLPTNAELIAHQALIVVARTASSHGLSPEDVQRSQGKSNPARLPVLYLCGKGLPTSEFPAMTFANWPIPIPRLTTFIAGLK
jgi:two-component system chemotaxis response regulator CheY